MALSKKKRVGKRTISAKQVRKIASGRKRRKSDGTQPPKAVTPTSTPAASWRQADRAKALHLVRSALCEGTVGSLVRNGMAAPEELSSIDVNASAGIEPVRSLLTELSWPQADIRQACQQPLILPATVVAR